MPNAKPDDIAAEISSRSHKADLEPLDHVRKGFEQLQTTSAVKREDSNNVSKAEALQRDLASAADKVTGQHLNT